MLKNIYSHYNTWSLELLRVKAGAPIYGQYYIYARVPIRTTYAARVCPLLYYYVVVVVYICSRLQLCISIRYAKTKPTRY